eukprot:SAG31_NODE_779_length_12158_cov_8.740194_9_plen_325_part_00
MKQELRAAGLEPSKVKTVLIGGLTAGAAGSARGSSGARIGLPFVALEHLGYNLIRKSPLGPNIPGGWDGTMGQELYDTLAWSADELAWVVAHEVSHLRHEDSAARALSLPLGLLAYHATSKILWRTLVSTRRLQPAPGLRPGLLLLGPIVLWISGVYTARHQEHAADAAASGVTLLQGPCTLESPRWLYHQVVVRCTLLVGCNTLSGCKSTLPFDVIGWETRGAAHPCMLNHCKFAVRWLDWPRAFVRFCCSSRFYLSHTTSYDRIHSLDSHNCTPPRSNGTNLLYRIREDGDHLYTWFSHPPTTVRLARAREALCASSSSGTM